MTQPPPDTPAATTPETWRAWLAAQVMLAAQDRGLTVLRLLVSVRPLCWADLRAEGFPAHERLGSEWYAWCETDGPAAFRYQLARAHGWPYDPPCCARLVTVTSRPKGDLFEPASPELR